MRIEFGDPTGDDLSCSLGKINEETFGRFKSITYLYFVNQNIKEMKELVIIYRNGGICRLLTWKNIPIETFLLNYIIGKDIKEVKFE